MNIEVRLFATLREERGKILQMNLADAATVRDISRTLSIREDDIAILLVNGIDGSLDTVLKDGDTVSLFPPVGGG